MTNFSFISGPINCGAVCAALCNCKEKALYQISFGLDWIARQTNQILVFKKVIIILIFTLPKLYLIRGVFHKAVRKVTHDFTNDLYMKSQIDAQSLLIIIY